MQIYYTGKSALKFISFGKWEQVLSFLIQNIKALPCFWCSVGFGRGKHLMDDMQHIGIVSMYVLYMFFYMFFILQTCEYVMHDLESVEMRFSFYIPVYPLWCQIKTNNVDHLFGWPPIIWQVGTKFKLVPVKH